jgi:hypothetical protein
LGMGGGTPWVPIPNDHREALTLETVKVAAELGVAVEAAALEAARALGYNSVIAYLQNRAR